MFNIFLFHILIHQEEGTFPAFWLLLYYYFFPASWLLLYLLKERIEGKIKLRIIFFKKSSINLSFYHLILEKMYDLTFVIIEKVCNFLVFIIEKCIFATETFKFQLVMKRNIYKRICRPRMDGKHPYHSHWHIFWEMNSGKVDSIYKEISYKLLYIIHYK